MIRFNSFNNTPKLNFQAAKPVLTSNVLGDKQNQDSFQMSVGYVNDLHGQTNNQLRILSGIEGDLRLSGGDDQIGNEKNRPTNMATIHFLDAANINARAIGNHEMDTNIENFCELIKNYDSLNFNNIKCELIVNDSDICKKKSLIPKIIMNMAITH